MKLFELEPFMKLSLFLFALIIATMCARCVFVSLYVCDITVQSKQFVCVQQFIVFKCSFFFVDYLFVILIFEVFEKKKKLQELL